MPAAIDKLVKKIKKDNPSYDDAKAFATAWSIYCKHINPKSKHCKASEMDLWIEKVAIDLGGLLREK
jgi:hypothetical protein